nr:hypothetical protein [Tanacetum cinerariifolium]
ADLTIELRRESKNMFLGYLVLELTCKDAAVTDNVPVAATRDSGRPYPLGDVAVAETSVPVPRLQISRAHLPRNGENGEDGTCGPTTVYLPPNLGHQKTAYVTYFHGVSPHQVFPTVADWRVSAPKDEMPAKDTYSPEPVAVLNTHRTPIQKQPEALLCLVGLIRRYFLEDDVYPKFLHDDDREMDLFNLICAPNPTKENPAARIDSSGIPSTIERSPLDFANENPSQQSIGGDRTEDQGQETVAPEVPPLENVTTRGVAPETGPMEEIGTMGPRVIKEHRKRGNNGVDANAPPKGAVVAGDPESENTSFTSMVGSPESIYHPEWGVTNDCRLDTPEACQDLVDHIASPGIQASENEIKNLEALLEAETDMKKAAKAKNTELAQVTGKEKLKAVFEEFKQYEDDRVEKRCTKMDARLDALSIDFNKELYPHMLTVIAGHRWVIGHGLRLAVMKCGESTELRQVFADVVSAGIAKGMSEGLKYRVEHGKANLDLEAIEAYDPEADTKYVAALHALRDLKYPMVDQLESLKNALIDVIMASLHLESDSEEDAPQWIRELRLSFFQLKILVYPEVRDPKDPWSCKEEILLGDAITTNVSRAEKKKKCQVACRTHGVGFAHHARSDGVLVSVPTVAPQGLAILLADAATQTETSEDGASPRLLRSKSLPAMYNLD